MSVQRPELPRPPENRQMHHHTLDAEDLKRLSEGPKTGAELSQQRFDPGSRLRDMVYRFKTPRSPKLSGDGPDYPQWSTVYYLYGDDRRAIRKVILENEAYIETAFEADCYNLFAVAWTDAQYRLLCEEWEYYRRHDGFEDY